MAYAAPNSVFSLGNVTFISLKVQINSGFLWKDGTK